MKFCWGKFIFCCFLLFLPMLSVGIHSDRKSHIVGLIIDTVEAARNQDPGKQFEKKSEEVLNDKSLFELGLAYFNGVGVEKDPCRAAEYFRKLAKKGHVDSQYNLAVIFETNMCKCSESDEKAAFWFQKAAEKGHIYSTYNLGLMNLKGRGVKQNYNKAFELFLKGAKAGHAGSQYWAAVMLGKGVGTEKNIKLSILFLQQAASQNNKQAIQLLKLLSNKSQ